MTKDTPEQQMSDGEVLANRKWPTWFSVEQMRAQLRHEEKGCPPPWPGAVWNGYNYVGGKP